MGWLFFFGFIIWVLYSILQEKISPPRPRSSLPNKNAWDGKIDGKGITPGSNWDLLRKSILRRDNYACQSCGRKDNLTVDHIVQLSIGGTNNPENLRTLCKKCHEEKDNKRIFNRPFNHDDNYGSNTTNSPVINALERAIRTGAPLRIAYTDIHSKTTYRDISPTHFTKEHGIPYVVAFCHLRNEKRTFRLSRIKLL